MKIDSTLSMVLNIIGCICGWSTVGLGIASVVSNKWLHIILSDNYRGLWLGCFGSVCNFLPEVQPWLHATQTLMVLMVCFVFLGGVLNIISMCRVNEMIRQLSGSLFLIAALLGVAGVSLYTGFIPRELRTGTFIYDIGYILAWVSIGVLFISNLFIYISIQKMMQSYAA